MENEIWKTLPFDSNYAVSSLGRVKSLPRTVNGKNGKLVPFTKPGLILKGRITGIGLSVGIGKIPYRKEYKLNYLVFITFNGYIGNGLFIYHKDGNVLNNNINNLILKTVFEIHNVDESEFKPVQDWPSYVINKDGIVLNIENGNSCNWSYSIANKCWTVRLWKNNTSKLFYLYRLVAIAFIPNPENKPQVNHIDGDRFNLKLTNLEWCTASENMEHAVRTGIARGQFERGVNNRYRHLKIKA